MLTSRSPECIDIAAASFRLSCSTTFRALYPRPSSSSVWGMVCFSTRDAMTESLPGSHARHLDPWTMMENDVCLPWFLSLISRAVRR